MLTAPKRAGQAGGRDLGRARCERSRGETSSPLIAVAGENGLDEGGAGVTAAVQIADHGIDVVGDAVLLGDQVTGPDVGKEQPAGLAGRPGHPGAAGVEDADAGDHPVGLIVGVAAYDHVGIASGQQAVQVLVGQAGVDAGAVVGAG